MDEKVVGNIIPQSHVQCAVTGCERDYVCVLRDLTVVPPNLFHPSTHLVVEDALVQVVCESFKEKT